jgi:hypothetical protein
MVESSMLMEGNISAPNKVEEKLRELHGGSSWRHLDVIRT